MSNPLAIAAVTAALRNLLTQGLTADSDLSDATVTMQPLDRARANGNTANQVNIFLYHAAPSAAWRNTDIPGRIKPGETALPALGLNLYYLITAYGRDNDTKKPFSHHLLGRAISTLQDHPILGADEIKTALPNNDLWQQVERVRFSLQPFTLEEISKLWTGFQTQYRLSVAYEAAVVLIDSQRAISAPLPVLTRGPADSGVVAQADLVPPFPAIDGVNLPNQQSSALLGDTLTITGNHLDGDKVVVQFSHPRLPAPISVPVAAGGTDTQISVQVPKDPVNWPAGLYTIIAIVSRKGEPDRTTNGMALSIAPQITSPMPMKAKRSKGDVSLSMTCAPQVRPDQRIALLLASQEVIADSFVAQTDQLSFTIRQAVPGEYLVRLRVDGVDSLLVDRSVTPPIFDKSQKVKIS
jgi:Pvc16 N-terminal domain